MSLAILHVTHSVNPDSGGTVEALKQVGLVHRDMGHTVEVVSLDRSSDTWLREFPLPTFALGADRDGGGSYGYSSKIVPWLRENRKRYRAVISHGLWQYHERAVHSALRGTTTPYYVFPHGMLDPWFRRTYPLKHLKKQLYWMWAEYRVLRDARAVLFTCEEERLLARNTFRPYCVRERVVPLGIAAPEGDPESQKRAFFDKFPALEGRRLLLFLGRLHAKKGCEMLVETFAQLQKTDAPPMHLVLAGPCADPVYLEKLRSLSARLCPPDAVSFPGMLSGDLKWGAFHASEVFVLPSHQENFGIAVVEALASGLPVLISNEINIWREIEQGGAGLVESDDVPGTLSLLTRWTNLSAEKRQAMRQAARVCFLERFEIQRTAKELLNVISPP